MCLQCYIKCAGTSGWPLPVNIVLYCVMLLVSPFVELAHWVWWVLHPAEALERKRANERFYQSMRDAIMAWPQPESDKAPAESDTAQ